MLQELQKQKDRKREQSHGHKKSLSEEKLFCEPNDIIPESFFDGFKRLANKPFSNAVNYANGRIPMTTLSFE